MLGETGGEDGNRARWTSTDQGKSWRSVATGTTATLFGLEDL